MGQMVGAFNATSSRNKNSNATTATTNRSSKKKKPKKRKDNTSHHTITGKSSHGMPIVHKNSHSCSSSACSSSYSGYSGYSGLSDSTSDDDTAASNIIGRSSGNLDASKDGYTGGGDSGTADVITSAILGSLHIQSHCSRGGGNSKFEEISINNRNGKIVLVNGEEEIDVTQAVVHSAVAASSDTNYPMIPAFSTTTTAPPFLSTQFSSFMTRHRKKKDVPSPSKNYEPSMSSSSIIQPTASNQQNPSIQSNYADYSSKIIPQSFPSLFSSNNASNENTTTKNTTIASHTSKAPNPSKATVAAEDKKSSKKPSVTMATETPSSITAAAATATSEEEEEEDDEEPVEMEQLIAMMRNHKVSDETASFSFNFGTHGQHKNFAAAVAAAAVNASSSSSSSSIPNSTPEFKFSFAAAGNIPMKHNTTSEHTTTTATTTSPSNATTTTTITTTPATATMTNNHEIPFIISDAPLLPTSPSSKAVEKEEEEKTVELTPEEQNYYRFVYEHQSAYIDINHDLDIDKYEDDYPSGSTEVDTNLSPERQQQLQQEIVSRRKILPLPRLRRKKKAVLDQYGFSDAGSSKSASTSSSMHSLGGANAPIMPLLKFDSVTTAATSTTIATAENSSNSSDSSSNNQSFCFPSTSLLSKNMFNFYPTTTTTATSVNVNSGSPSSTLSFHDLAKKLSNENQQHRSPSFDGSFGSDTDTSSSQNSGNAKKMKWSGSSVAARASTEAMIVAAADSGKRKQRNWIESFSGDLSDLQKEIDLRKQQQQQQNSNESSAISLNKDTMTLPKAVQATSPTNTNTINVNTTDTPLTASTNTVPDVCASAEIDRMLHDFKILSQSPAFKMATTNSPVTADNTERPIATAHSSRIRHTTKGKARRSTPFTTPPVSNPMMTTTTTTTTTAPTVSTLAPSSALAAITQARQLDQQKLATPPTSSTFAVPNVVTKKFLAPSAQQLQQEEQQQQQSSKKKGSIFDPSGAKKAAFATKTMGMAVTAEGVSGKKKVAASKKAAAALSKSSSTTTLSTATATTTTSMSATASGKKNKKNKNKNKEQQDDFMAPGGFLSSDISLFDNPIPDEWVCLFCQYDILMYGYEQAKKKNGFYKRKRQKEKKMREAELRKKEKENVACENEHNHHHHHSSNSNTTKSQGQDITTDTMSQQQTPSNGSANVDIQQQQQAAPSPFASAK